MNMLYLTIYLGVPSFLSARFYSFQLSQCTVLISLVKFILYYYYFFFFKEPFGGLFIYLFLTVLGLRFCARAFSSCGKRGPLFIAVRGPPTIAAPPLLRSTGSRRASSVTVAHGPSRSAACGILPDQGSNPCPLH